MRSSDLEVIVSDLANLTMLSPQQAAKPIFSVIQNRVVLSHKRND